MGACESIKNENNNQTKKEKEHTIENQKKNKRTTVNEAIIPGNAIYINSVN